MVNLTLQSPSFDDKNLARFPGVFEVPYMTYVGFDLDHSAVTVYVDDNGCNYTLAVRADYMNEDGVDCGPIGYEVKPEPEVIAAHPELAKFVGWRFGRVIVTDGSGEGCAVVDMSGDTPIRELVKGQS